MTLNPYPNPPTPPLLPQGQHPCGHKVLLSLWQSGLSMGSELKKFKTDWRDKMKDALLKLYVKFQTLTAVEEGQDLVEYALLITLVALAAVAGINKVASAINTVFSNISATLS
jgi:pilus assembly protein Flp/PilA